MKCAQIADLLPNFAGGESTQMADSNRMADTIRQAEPNPEVASSLQAVSSPDKGANLVLL